MHSYIHESSRSSFPYCLSWSWESWYLPFFCRLLSREVGGRSLRPAASAREKSQPGPGTAGTGGSPCPGAARGSNGCGSIVPHRRSHSRSWVSAVSPSALPFRDLLQNFLAGILLLLHEPFRLGEQIKMDEFEGTVEEIETRATVTACGNSQRRGIHESRDREYRLREATFRTHRGQRLRR